MASKSKKECAKFSKKNIKISKRRGSFVKIEETSKTMRNKLFLTVSSRDDRTTSLRLVRVEVKYRK